MSNARVLAALILVAASAGCRQGPPLAGEFGHPLPVAAVAASRTAQSESFANLSTTRVMLTRDAIPTRKIQLNWHEYRSTSEQHYGVRLVASVPQDSAIEIVNLDDTADRKALLDRDPRHPNEVKNEIYLYWDEIDKVVRLELWKDGALAWETTTTRTGGALNVNSQSLNVKRFRHEVGSAKGVRVRVIAYGNEASFLLMKP